MNELNKCSIHTHTNLWRYVLSACGFGFASEWWSVEQNGIRVAQVFLIGIFVLILNRYAHNLHFVRKIRFKLNGLQILIMNCVYLRFVLE